MSAVVSVSHETLWFDVCEWEGWDRHISGLHVVHQNFKHHVPANFDTKWSYWLVFVAAACAITRSEDIEFTPQMLGSSTGEEVPDTSSANTFTSSTSSLSETSNIPEELCLYGEMHWCGMYYSVGSSVEGCNTSDPCKYQACANANTLSENYPRHLQCLQEVCPPKYSDRYVECSIDMAAGQAECLRNLVTCSDQSIRECYLNPRERFEWMRDCL